MIDSIVQNRLDSLTKEYKSFVLSNFVSETASHYAIKLRFDEDQSIVLENGLAMYVLLFFNPPEFSDFVSRECNLDSNIASKLVTEILSTLPQQVTTAIEEGYMFFENTNETSEDVAQNKAAIPGAGVNELTIEEKKAEATGKAVSLKDKEKAELKKQAEHAAKGIRTMRDDVERLRGTGDSGANSTSSIPAAPASGFTKPFKGS